MQRSLNLILLLISILLVYFSFITYTTLTKFENLVIRVNEDSRDQPASAKAETHSDWLAEFERLHASLPWDADLTSMLIIVVNNLVNETLKKGRQQTLVSKAEDYYKHSLSFRPRDVQVLSGQLDLLIDQGAPADYILPKLDNIISLVPKDQDLKAELALICFKMLSINPQPPVQEQIINRLQSLFHYSMDYRGLIIVRRYAKIYGQEEVLKSILSQIN